LEDGSLDFEMGSAVAKNPANRQAGKISDRTLIKSMLYFQSGES
jgi:hypothetical protein